MFEETREGLSFEWMKEEGSKEGPLCEWTKEEGLMEEPKEGPKDLQFIIVVV